MDVIARKATLLKMPFATRHFNANQRVWVLVIRYRAVYCIGKFRGSGRYVKAWVHWKGNIPLPLNDIVVTRAFAERLHLSSAFGTDNG
jgi:hypothetical protein